MYKLPRDAIFAGDQNPGFFLLYFWGSVVINPCAPYALQNFEDLIFVDDKLPAKTA